MIWMLLGRSALKKGPHILTLRVLDRATGSSRYFLAMDSVVITRYAFTPAGTAKPPLASVSDSKPVPNPSYRPAAPNKQNNQKKKPAR